MSQRKEPPLVRRRIEALLLKAVASRCTEGEAAAALEKAEELTATYGIDPGSFRWPPRPSAASEARRQRRAHRGRHGAPHRSGSARSRDA
jgi:hypothetical protein